MIKFYTNIISIQNIYKKPTKSSEVVSQLLYGDSFSIKKRLAKWIKIKTKEDNYFGFIQNKNYSEYSKPTHKVNVLKAKIYKFPNKLKKINELSFNSKIKIFRKKNGYFKFTKGWVNLNQVKPINFTEKNPLKRVNLFKNIKYKWGGKSFKGIDCSALVQICLNFNNKFCPRDTKDQIKYFKKNISLNKIKKNDIIYWKGHVAVATSKNMLIHAYGPMKKTVKMDLEKTVKLIKRTAKLDIRAIKRL
jgi:gamma-D-glutamyl-L-lysine dipeptidyl-peptidase